MREDGWGPWSPGRTAELPGLATVIGHRGAAARAPENTLAGLRKAHELGARWVEFDVMLSRDGVPVLIHDETLRRTTDGRGRVARHTAAELGLLDAGAWFAPEFAGERIPTLAEAVAVLLELGLNANVEIKPASGHEVATGEAVADALQRLWPEHGPQPAAVELRARSTWPPHDKRHLTSRVACSSARCRRIGRSHWKVWPARPCISTRAEPLPIPMRMLTAAGVPTLFYTVNDVARARELLAAGAAALFTDLPDVLLASLAAQ